MYVCIYIYICCSIQDFLGLKTQFYRSQFYEVMILKVFYLFSVNSYELGTWGAPGMTGWWKQGVEVFDPSFSLFFWRNFVWIS